MNTDPKNIEKTQDDGGYIGEAIGAAIEIGAEIVSSVL